MYNRILLTSDGSRNSEIAIQHALQIASDEGAEVIVLHVVNIKHNNDVSQEDIGKEVPFDKYSQKVLNQFEKVIQDLENENEEYSRLNIIKLSIVGRPSDVILKVCEDENIDLIVMSNSGKSKVNRFLLGSVTEKVIRESPVPVLVIPANYSPN